MSFPKTSHLVQGQVPEFIKSDSPKFLDFLRKYYEFMEEYNVRIETLKDPDLVPDNLIAYLKREVARYFPKAAINERQLLKIIRQLYDAKGTIDAVELFFKVFFNDAIVASEPNRNILRASDGRWEQFNSITLEQVYGTFDPEDDLFLTVKNQYGTFVIEVEYVVQASNTISRFFYRSFNIAQFNEGQAVDIIKNGVVTYRGHLLKSPSKITVVTPGNKWKVGQLIRIPGTIADTIAKVSKVGVNGVLEQVDIVEYGYEHSENQSVIVSPYPNKPSGADYDLQIAITGFDGTNFTYAYTLSVTEYLNSLTENVIGLSNAIDSDSYFLEQPPNNYVAGDYTAKLVINVSSDTVGSSTGIVAVDPELTLQDWLASRAVLRYDFDVATKYPGKYLGDEGQISNPNMRLQDNYFYQLFSYVIQTTKDISEYSPGLNLIHPAGRIFFGQLVKTSVIDFDNIEVSRNLSNGSKYFNELISVGDSVTVIPNAGIQSSVSAVDASVEKAISKTVALDFATAGDSPIITSITLGKSDSVVTTDSFSIGTLVISFQETVVSSDLVSVGQFFTASPEVVATSDSIALTPVVALTGDSATITDTSPTLFLTNLQTPTDSITLDDATLVKQITLVPTSTDSAVIDDSTLQKLAVVALSDSTTQNDGTLVFGINKTTNPDAASATDSGSPTVVSGEYSANYFSQDYSIISTTITI